MSALSEYEAIASGHRPDCDSCCPFPPGSPGDFMWMGRTEHCPDDCTAEVPVAVLLKADAAIESLKCCGNCSEWCEGIRECGTDRQDERGCVIDCRGSDACHFTPSRWQERTS